MNKILSLMTLALTLSSGFAVADASNPTDDFAKAKYESLTSDELDLQFITVNGPMVGVATAQKTWSDGRYVGFCRKYTPIVPNPISSYICWAPFSSPEEAEALFNGSPAQSMNVAFSREGHLVLGVHHEEKTLQRGNIICTATSPVVPQPTVTYTCYTVLHPPVGGGASVSN